MRQSKRELWNHYQHEHKPLFRRAADEYDKWIVEFLEELLSQLPDGATVVDYGAGDCVFPAYLAPKYAVRWVCLEWNSVLLWHAKRMLRGVHNVELVRCDISTVALSCDMFIAMGVLEHFSDPVTVLSKWVHKLTDEGLCFVKNANLWSKLTQNRLRLKAEGANKRTFMVFEGPFVYGYQQVYTLDHLVRFMEDAGLRVVRAGEMPVGRLDIYAVGKKIGL